MIRAGIGVEYGRVLMIKAGYRGSNINDVVWMGDAVNRASELSSYAGKFIVPRIYVGSVFHRNLSEPNKTFSCIIRPRMRMGPTLSGQIWKIGGRRTARTNSE